MTNPAAANRLREGHAGRGEEELWTLKTGGNIGTFCVLERRGEEGGESNPVGWISSLLISPARPAPSQLGPTGEPHVV